MGSIELLQRPGGFRNVVVVTGHMTDSPARTTARFPESEVARVRECVRSLFVSWGLDDSDLLICGGARGGDLIAAFEAQRLGATVWVLLARPIPQFVLGSVAGADPAWVDEFWRLLQREPSWQLDQVDGGVEGDDVYAATNDWMLDTAIRQSAGSRFGLLAIWDGTDGGGTGGAAQMVEVATARGADVEVVDPRPGVCPAPRVRSVPEECREG